MKIKVFAIFLTLICVLTFVITSVGASPVAQPTPSTHLGYLNSTTIAAAGQSIRAQYILGCQLYNVQAVYRNMKPALLVAQSTIINNQLSVSYYVLWIDLASNVNSVTSDVFSKNAVIQFTAPTSTIWTFYSFSKDGGISSASSTMLFSQTSYTMPDDQLVVYDFRSSLVTTNSLALGNYTADVPAYVAALDAFNGSSSGSGPSDDYNLGYEDGERQGYLDGYKDAEDYYNPLLDIKYRQGYIAGYNEGKDTEGSAIYDLDIPQIITSIPAAVQSFFGTAFDLNIFGINLAGLLTTLMVLAVVVFAIGLLVDRWKK